MANIFLISSKLPPEYSGSGNRVFRTALNLEKNLITIILWFAVPL